MTNLNLLEKNPKNKPQLKERRTLKLPYYRFKLCWITITGKNRPSKSCTNFATDHALNIMALSIWLRKGRLYVIPAWN